MSPAIGVDTATGFENCRERLPKAFYEYPLLGPLFRTGRIDCVSAGVPVRTTEMDSCMHGRARAKRPRCERRKISNRSWPRRGYHRYERAAA